MVSLWVTVSPSSYFTVMFVAETAVTSPAPLALMQTSESTAHLCSMPVATMGASVTMQGHSLALHVGAHEGPVGVVVLQEGNEGCGHGAHHLGRHVNVIDGVPVHFNNLVAVAASDTGIGQAAVFVQALIGLGHIVVVFHIGGHILYRIGDEAGLLVHLPEGSLHKAVLVDPGHRWPGS